MHSMLEKKRIKTYKNSLNEIFFILFHTYVDTRELAVVETYAIVVLSIPHK